MDTDSPFPPTHHLMRVRVRTRIFSRLRDIAQDESHRNGDYTSISDIVRAALSDWIRVHDSTLLLQDLQESRDERKIPVG